MLTILSYGEGKCCWCCQAGEGVQASFKDGLSGFFCKKDLWAALKARSEPKEAANADSPGGQTGGRKEPVIARGGA